MLPQSYTLEVHIVVFLIVFISIQSVFLYTTLGCNLPQDACCFPKANSTNISCNITIDLPSSMVEEDSSLILELCTTNHNLVCNQSQLTVTVVNTGAGVCPVYMHMSVIHQTE